MVARGWNYWGNMSSADASHSGGDTYAYDVEPLHVALWHVLE
jgi:hypothetical protein